MINWRYAVLGILLVAAIFAFIISIPINDDDMIVPRAVSVGYNESELSCMKHPEFCKYPLNLTFVMNYTGGSNAK